MGYPACRNARDGDGSASRDSSAAPPNHNQCEVTTPCQGIRSLVVMVAVEIEVVVKGPGDGLGVDVA